MVRFLSGHEATDAVSDIAAAAMFDVRGLMFDVKPRQAELRFADFCKIVAVPQTQFL
jgi:hypothetical protein